MSIINGRTGEKTRLSKDTLSRKMKTPSVKIYLQAEELNKLINN